MLEQKQGLSRRHKSTGFTLIEIMVVVTIIAILAGFIMPKFMGQLEKAKISKAKADIRSLESALNLYKLDNHEYPSTDEGLEALLSGGPDGDGYIETLRKDPWDEAYQYLNPGVNSKIDIYSLGADRQEGGDGVDADIGNWETE